jgi:hypothetical protein
VSPAKVREEFVGWQRDNQIAAALCYPFPIGYNQYGMHCNPASLLGCTFSVVAVLYFFFYDS